ncbi:MAG TPA: hypothetical protein VLB44_00490, partial [Kofleriaceae bacterium]|nr:hypothetical protein [Kofleriaceae bacterium]
MATRGTSSISSTIGIENAWPPVAEWTARAGFVWSTTFVTVTSQRRNYLLCQRLSSRSEPPRSRRRVEAATRTMRILTTAFLTIVAGCSNPQATPDAGITS